MKISRHWLEEILGRKLELTTDELSARLLSLGFETASARDFRACSGIVAAEILAISKHPNADRLRIAQVTDGKETLELVCGAPNIRVGQKVLWAKTGAVLADGTQLKLTSIRGVPSPGMICSLAELGVGEDHSGIWELDPQTAPGTPLEKIAPLEDTVLELEVTPNRPDCLSVAGIARELAAAGGFALNLPEPEKIPALPAYPVEIHDKEACPRYIARRIESVQVKASPPALQVRLVRAGTRPISNLVDITNLVLQETGQPLHVFDADKLEGGKIVVRRAQAGEKILALDGKTYALTPDLLVIADARKPVAIAGVMGGEETAVTAATKNILLESAVFDKKRVRLARKTLNLASESSYRFERGVSSWSAAAGSARAERMILELAGGKTTACSDAAARPESRPDVQIRIPRIEKILGAALQPAQAESLLKKLGIPVIVSDATKITARSPGWRLDLEQEIDFIEEIGRLMGYDTLPSLGNRALLTPSRTETRRWESRKRTGQLLQSLGFNEACNYGLVSKKHALHFLQDADPVELENPLSEEQSVLKPSLLIDLLQNIKLNLSYHKQDVRLYEQGHVFQSEKGHCSEKAALAGAALGGSQDSGWQFKEPAPVDFFWIKGVVEKLLSAFNPDSFDFPEMSRPLSQRLLHPLYGREIALGRDKTLCGRFGLIHPQTAKLLDISDQTVFFEIHLEELEKNSLSVIKITPPLRTPFIQRDCTVLVENGVSWRDLEGEILRSGGEILQDCRLFDLYKGDRDASRKSLSFTLTFRHPEKTLDDDTANRCRDAIVENLGKKFGAEMRKK